ncbi:MAG: hypothetical protein JKY19_05600 [Alcanivoracaceae bacterium]|nr:hypothetical protein [Alcanivoracaceae bacterium]
MFLVIDPKLDNEEIGRAEIIKRGFKVKIFNGENIYYLKAENNNESYRVFKRLGNTVVQEIGRAFCLNTSSSIIEFDLGNNSCVYRLKILLKHAKNSM